MRQLKTISHVSCKRQLSGGKPKRVFDNLPPKKIREILKISFKTNWRNQFPHEGQNKTKFHAGEMVSKARPRIIPAST